jgi:prepilin-type N-terminal cleavage/methylation domain-containing protein
MAFAAAVRRRAQGESGFSLVELLVVISLLTLVLSAAMGSLVFAQNETPKTVEYAHAISSAATGLQKMLREIRNAYRINGTNGDATSGTGSMIDFYAVIGPNDLHIQYECDEPSPTNTGYDACLRLSAPTGTALPGFAPGCPTSLAPSVTCSVVINRVRVPAQVGQVFTFIGASGSPNSVYPTYVRANIQVPRSGPLTHGFTNFINLDDGTAIPDLQNGQ